MSKPNDKGITIFTFAVKPILDDNNRPEVSRVESLLIDLFYQVLEEPYIEKVVLKIEWPDGKDETWAPDTVPDYFHYNMSNLTASKGD